MSDRTSIEWTDASWTPIRARFWEIQNDGSGKERIGWHCEHVSEGCRNCYAEGINRRLGTGLDFKPGNLFRQENLRYANGASELFLDEKMLLAPLKWKKQRMIFVCSMTDLFADFVTDEMILRVLDVIRRTSWDGGSNCGTIDHGNGEHTYQILTKRPARMAAFMKRLRFGRDVDEGGLYLADDNRAPLVMKNVWLGVSAEDQPRADERIPDLLATPAAVRFVSLEPLLGAIDLTAINQNCCLPFPGTLNAVRGTLWPSEGLMDVGVEPMIGPRLDWVIVGGESGPKARPMHSDWARSLRDQCRSAEVPFFFKQWGEHAPTLCDKLPIEMIRVGKRKAGRLLDGVEHNGMPHGRP